MAIFGPGDPARFLFLFRAIRRGRFLMFGKGETLYHPLYIDNLVDAFELAAARPGTGEVYLIGDADYYSLNDLVRAVATSMNMEVRIIHLPFRPLWWASTACEFICRPLNIEPPLFRRRLTGFGRIVRSALTRHVKDSTISQKLIWRLGSRELQNGIGRRGICECC